jgi:hypothetical protein
VGEGEGLLSVLVVVSTPLETVIVPSVTEIVDGRIEEPPVLPLNVAGAGAGISNVCTAT